MTVKCEHPGHSYTLGCRCLQCRCANAAESGRYRELRRRGVVLKVSPERARLHLLQLSECGIGAQSVSLACDVSVRTLMSVRTNKHSLIRRSIEQKILSVTTEAFSEGSRIDATPTRRLTEQLIREGFSKADLVRRVNVSKNILAWKRKRVTGSTAVKVDRFYRMVMAGGDDE